MALNVVILGPPGAGKGTQAERFAREHGIPKISTGDILREAVQSGHELGRMAIAIMDRGELVSDEVMVGIVRDRLARVDTQQGFVLDGFPRTVAQAVALDTLLADRTPLTIVELAVPQAELVRRLGARRVCGQCGVTSGAGSASATCERCGGQLVQRGDDSEAVVRERLNVYSRDTEPLVRHYRERPKFASIDGARSPDAVAQELRATIESLGRGDPARSDVPVTRETS